ncbi:MAG: hypothetical protein J6W06_00730 [Bacteroidales bacterium]|nr:hypothetical protein [Bacteroidales bacterium]
MQRGFLDIFFKVISVLGHPILIPTYFALLIDDVYGLSTFAVAGFTLVFPVIVILFISAIKMYRDKASLSAGNINGANLEDRIVEMSDDSMGRLERLFDSTSSRRMALNVELCCAAVGYIFIASQMMKLLMILIGVAALSCMLINNFWRISIHAFGWGFALPSIVKLMLLFYSPLTVVIVAILMCGLVLSSRLYLGRHNNLQVHLGFAIGASIAALLFLWTSF